MNQTELIKECQEVSQQWTQNFNQGNLDYCINAYEKNATMVVKNVGEFVGHDAIRAFWTELTQTANYLEYSNTQYKVIDEKTVHLNSDWKMNIAEGIITLEEWVKQDNGSWKLSQDAFEVLKQYD